VSLGTLAAGTAHEISTPLSNIGMMADELVNTPEDMQLVKDYALLIKQQQALCMGQLQTLRSVSEQAVQEKTTQQTIEGYLKNITDRWSAMRPDIKVQRTFHFEENPEVCIDSTLTQAIINLMNNAADASLDNNASLVAISSEIKNAFLIMHIDDFGTGFSDEQLNMAGDLSFTTKTDGLGIGLILSHASLARYEGKLTLHHREDGIRTTVSIPLEKLSPS